MHRAQGRFSAGSFVQSLRTNSPIPEPRRLPGPVPLLLPSRPHYTGRLSPERYEGNGDLIQ